MVVAQSLLNERRDSSRVPFGTTISIGFDVLEASDLQAVQAIDLSHSGLLFSTETWPQSDRVVVAFETEKKTSTATAEVVSCARELLENGESHFKVRCRFITWD